MNVLGKIAERFTTAVRSLHQDLTTRREQIAAKRQERDHAQDGPLPRPEVLTRFNQSIDAMAAYQAKEHVESLVVHHFGAAPHRTEGRPPWVANTPVSWGFLALFCGDLLKARFAELAAAVEYVPGPPAAARAALVARLEGELAELEAQEEQLIDQAAEAGVAIEHRAEVLERRQNEQRRAQLTEQAEAGRREREAAVNAGHATRASRVTRSSYLEPR
jgi:hypothetical protein